MPNTNGDLEKEEGHPGERGEVLARLIAAQQAVHRHAPEYNNSRPPLLKNAIDWVSRYKAGADGIAFRHKVFGVGTNG